MSRVALMKSTLELRPRRVGGYLMFGEIASGGMATVHLGRVIAPAGFSDTVAIKRLHAHFAADPEFVTMFLDEARLAARVRHPNVVSTRDIVRQDDELFLIMDYVQGASLAQLLQLVRRAGTPMPLGLATFIVAQTLLGLHAAHEATNEQGEALRIIHRDVSPHNILIGADGIVRVIDFGVAKAAARLATTRDGRIKGKLAYMAPEQLREGALDRRVDVFTASIVLYELLTLQQLFAANETAATLANILTKEIAPPSRLVPDIPAALDEIVLKALEREPGSRFLTAHEMARALQARAPMGNTLELSRWVESVAGDVLQRRRELLRAIEAQPTTLAAAALAAPAAVSLEHEPPEPERAGAQTELSSVRSALLPDAGRRSRRIATLVAGVGAAGLSIWGFTQSYGSTEQNGSSALAKPTDQVRPVLAPPVVPPPAPDPVKAPDAAGKVTPPVQEPLKTSGTDAGTPNPAPPSSSRPPVRPPTRGTPGPGEPPAEKSTTRDKRSACEPPYTLNPDGTKRFKTECF